MRHSGERKKKEDIGGNHKIDRCAWETNGVRCQMPGTINPSPSGTGRWFCLWHYNMGIASPELVKFSDSLEAFVSWIEAHRKAYQFPSHAVERGCPWCSHTLSSLWAALTKGVSTPLDFDPAAVEYAKQMDSGVDGGGYDKEVAADYSALINRILDRTVKNWRVDFNALNAKYNMRQFDVDPEPPVTERRRVYTGGHHKTAAEMEAEAKEAGLL